MQPRHRTFALLASTLGPWLLVACPDDDPGAETTGTETLTSTTATGTSSSETTGAETVGSSTSSTSSTGSTTGATSTVTGDGTSTGTAAGDSTSGESGPSSEGGTSSAESSSSATPSGSSDSTAESTESESEDTTGSTSEASSTGDVMPRECLELIEESTGGEESGNETAGEESCTVPSGGSVCATYRDALCRCHEYPYEYEVGYDSCIYDVEDAALMSETCEQAQECTQLVLDYYRCRATQACDAEVECGDLQLYECLAS